MFSAYGTLIIIYFIASVVIAMMFPQFNAHTTLFEYAFFFFAHRGFLLTLFALEGICFCPVDRPETNSAI
jgi:hypothetical protein